MTKQYLLTYFDANIEYFLLDGNTDESVVFDTKEQAFDYLLEQIKSKLKLRLRDLLPYENQADESNFEVDFKNLLNHSISLGIEGKKRLIDLYFNQKKSLKLDRFYRIEEMPAFQ